MNPKRSTSTFSSSHWRSACLPRRSPKKPDRSVPRSAARLRRLSFGSATVSSTTTTACTITSAIWSVPQIPGARIAQRRSPSADPESTGTIWSPTSDPTELESIRSSGTMRSSSTSLDGNSTRSSLPTAVSVRFTRNSNPFSRMRQEAEQSSDRQRCPPDSFHDVGVQRQAGDDSAVGGAIHHRR